MKEKSKLCIGFGQYEGKCQNTAGSTHSIHWCQRCDELRLAHIEKQFEKISARMNPNKP
jgi:hypothetical protein